MIKTSSQVTMCNVSHVMYLDLCINNAVRIVQFMQKQTETFYNKVPLLTLVNALKE